MNEKQLIKRKKRLQMKKISDEQMISMAKKYINLYCEYLEEAGFNCKQITEIKLSNARHTCGYVKGNRLVASIHLTRPLFYDVDLMKNVIAHECVHLMKENNDHHGYNFRRIARYLTNKFGIKIQRLASPEDSEKFDKIYNELHKDKAGKTSEYKYALVCKVCGKTIAKYKRDCKAVQNYKDYYHTKDFGQVELVEL